MHSYDIRMALAAVISLITFVTSLGLLIGVASPLASADGWDATNYDWFYEAGSGDKFRTYDVVDGDDTEFEVDWPVRWVFKIDAEIDLVKDWLKGKTSEPNLSPELGNHGTPNDHFYDDTGSEQMDSDGGIKINSNCPILMDFHMRLYANSTNDYNYNTNWGQWIIATSHRDYERTDHIWPWTDCDSEYRSLEGFDEEWWQDRIDDGNSDPQVSDDWYYYGQYNLDNDEDVNGNAWWADATHQVQSDGYAHVYHIPGWD